MIHCTVGIEFEFGFGLVLTPITRVIASTAAFEAAYTVELGVAKRALMLEKLMIRPPSPIYLTTA